MDAEKSQETGYPWQWVLAIVTVLPLFQMLGIIYLCTLTKCLPRCVPISDVSHSQTAQNGTWVAL